MAILLSCSGMFQASKCMYLMMMLMLEKMDGGVLVLKKLMMMMLVLALAMQLCIGACVELC